MKRLAALTYIEILVVLAVMATIIIPLFISYTRTQANQTLRASSEQLADALRRAHVFAREARNEKSWGVKRLNAMTYALVAGTPSVHTTEAVTSLEPFLSFPSDFAVWFSVGTGDTDAPKSVIIKNRFDRQLTIRIEKTGIVEIKDQ